MRFRRRRFCAARLPGLPLRTSCSLTRLSLRTRGAVWLTRRAHKVVRLTRLAWLSAALRSARLSRLPRLSATLRAVLLPKLTRLSAALRAVLLPKLTRLPAALGSVRLPAALRRGTRRHARAMRPDNARRIEGRRSRCCCNRGMTAVGSSTQRRISESLLGVLVLQAGRRYTPFG